MEGFCFVLFVSIELNIWNLVIKGALIVMKACDRLTIEMKNQRIPL